ncbi:MAG: hypothetical protein JW742_02940, partial [Candidatus Aminicenantes bacterium]|nr:hypothetical protein [Candidatus Aminicenantes bacterium]
MSRKTLAVAAVLAFVLAVTGCAAKKHVQTIEEQKVQLDDAAVRISELEKGNAVLTKDLAETKTALEGSQAKTKELSSSVASLKEQL